MKKTSSQTTMSFSSLPEVITENILARISRWNYPSLSLVSKRFHSIISSMELYKTRSQIGTTETCVYVYLQLRNDPCPRWLSLCLNPNQTLKPSEKLISLTIPSSSPHSPPIPSCFTLAVGSEIYLIGGPDKKPSSSVRIFNFRSHTWRDAPNMTVARENVSAFFLDEKIYVLEGRVTGKSASYAEEFDIKTQSWRALPLPDDEFLKDLSGYSIATVVEGKLYIVAKEKDYTYEPKEGTWKVARKRSSWTDAEYLCVVENVMCSFSYDGECMWYDSKVRKWKEIKGLDELWDHHDISGSVPMVSHGGKLLVMWNSNTTFWYWPVKIMYAQIALERRCNGREMWGKVEWVDIMHKDRRSSQVILYDYQEPSTSSYSTESTSSSLCSLRYIRDKTLYIGFYGLVFYLKYLTCK